METTNCRNCGAPHDGKCGYCGTDYSPNLVPKGVNKKTNAFWDSLTTKQKTILAIGLVIAPYQIYRKYCK